MTDHSSTSAVSCLWFSSVALRLLFLVPALSILEQSHATDFSYPNTTLTRLAFGSCHKNKYAITADSDDNIWKTIQRQAHPQLWLWTGDAVYPPTRGIASLDLLKAQYDQMNTNDTIGFSSFNPPLGMFGTWDDHDYGANDAGVELSDKMERARLFWDFLGRDPPLGSRSKQHNLPDDDLRQGLYSSVTVGSPPHQVKIILLDTRWHRQVHCIPSVATKMPLGAGFACLTRWLSAGLFPAWCQRRTGTMLGEEQWAWLEQELRHSITVDEQAEAPAVTLVVSSIQVLSTNPTVEGWGHFAAERNRLIRLLSSTNSLVFVLSGDVHHAELLSVQSDGDDSSSISSSPLLEVTSSGLTHDCSKPIYGALCKPLLDTFSRHRFENRYNYFIGKNYGTVSVDWEQQTAEIRIHDMSGRTVLSTGARTMKRAVYPPLTEEQIQSIPACMDGHLQPLFQAIVAALVVAAVFLYCHKPKNR